jgi:hypothetical protein
MITVGIDYSIGGPAICIHYGKEWDIDNCYFYFLTDIKKYQKPHFDLRVFGETTGDKENEWKCDVERYNFRADWVIEQIQQAFKIQEDVEWEDVNVAMEGYSMNSKGLISSIIENAATLKHRLYFEDKIPSIIPPATIKKFATGKGNAQKHTMYAHFLDETGWDLHEVISPNKKVGTSPVADLVDAYYVCKYKFEIRMNRGRR